MIRFLKIARETGHLYFTDIQDRDDCIVCGGSDDIIWSYDTNKPIQDILQSLFDLIVNNSDDGGIAYIEDLELLQKELNFDLYIFNKFEEWLKLKEKLRKIKFEYMWVRDILQFHLKGKKRKNKND